eukprot:180882_1
MIAKRSTLLMTVWPSTSLTGNHRLPSRWPICWTTKTWAGSMSMGFLTLLIVLFVCILVGRSGGSTGDTDPDPSVTEPINSALPIGAQPSKSEDDVDLSTEDEKSAESLFIRKDVYIVGNVQKAAIFHPAFDKKYSSDTDVFGQDA